MTDRRRHPIHTTPSGEGTALANLERQGFEAFLPRLHTTVRRSGRYHRRIEALFPLNLSIRLDATGDDRRSIGANSASVDSFCSFMAPRRAPAAAAPQR